MGTIPTPNQSMPDKGKEDVIPKVIEMLKEREKVGIKKYNTTLQTWNNRNPIQDLQDELLDGLNYCMQFQMERDDLIKQITRLTNIMNEIKSHLINPSFDSKTTVRFIESSINNFESYEQIIDDTRKRK